MDAGRQLSNCYQSDRVHLLYVLNVFKDVFWLFCDSLRSSNKETREGPNSVGNFPNLLIDLCTRRKKLKWWKSNLSLNALPIFVRDPVDGLL